MPTWIIQILVGLALQVIAYAIMPKTKKQKPQAAADFDLPTVDAGRPIPVVFGKITVKGSNILWYGDKQVVTRFVY